MDPKLTKPVSLHRSVKKAFTRLRDTALGAGADSRNLGEVFEPYKRAGIDITRNRFLTSLQIWVQLQGDT